MKRPEGGKDARPWVVGCVPSLASRLRRLVVGVLLLGTLLLVATPLTWARSSQRLSAQNGRWLKKSYADALGIGLGRVVSAHVYDLDRVRGVAGFLLGRYRSKDRQGTFGAVVIYARCGKTYCVSRVDVGGAQKLRARRIVDLGATTTDFSPSTNWSPSHGHRLVEPRRSRWPALIIATQAPWGQELTEEMILISLRRPKHPRVLVRFYTRRRYVPRRKHFSRRCRSRRYVGSRVRRVRFFNKPPAAATLEVVRRRISSPTYRGLAPKPRVEHFVFKAGRFVRAQESPVSRARSRRR